MVRLVAAGHLLELVEVEVPRLLLRVLGEVLVAQVQAELLGDGQDQGVEGRLAVCCLDAALRQGRLELLLEIPVAARFRDEAKIPPR